MSVLSAVDSSYVFLAAPGLDSFNSNELPALLVAMEYLTATEGDFWRRIRGMGLSYGYSLTANVWVPVAGCIYVYFNFILYNRLRVVYCYSSY